MLELQTWLVDSFASKPFSGNPAAVVVLKEALPDSLLQAIALEFNQSETAFILDREGESPVLRWFTPIQEVDLCGHATLAAAYVWLNELYPAQSSVTFNTVFVGSLTVTTSPTQTGFLQMAFPLRSGKSLSIQDVPKELIERIHPTERPIAVIEARDLVLVYENPQVVKEYQPHYDSLALVKPWVCLTAPASVEESAEVHFISRFFDQYQKAEDPVTGSSFCTLAPYWANRLQQTDVVGYQASARGGTVLCHVNESQQQVLIQGRACLVSQGTLFLPYD
ncbi:MAG: PhzF family phenazine biosynthesis protein [Vampirovibrionales bacterium]